MPSVTANQAGRPPRASRTPVSDVPKPGCPFCDSTTSTVFKSRGDLYEEVYRRRRQCSECGRQWPTLALLDRRRFTRELAVSGLTLADLGLDERHPGGG
jgi:hypothetical protein